jgi:mitotic spindle assembly checkpoint protein MAD1
VEKEELRVQLSTLKYELENIKQERELEALRHEKETRDLQLKADADFRKAQVSRSQFLLSRGQLTIFAADCGIFE